MPPTLALATSIAVLGGLDTYLTATALPIPVWVTFIGWASFFACGGGVSGLVKSVASNWIGIVIASLCLLVISFAPGSPVVAAVSVGVGSGLMILAASAGFLGYPPAIVFGFAASSARRRRRVTALLMEGSPIPPSWPGSRCWWGPSSASSPRCWRRR